MGISVRNSVLLVFCLIVCVSTATAQTVGNINGRVTDNSDAVVPGVAITLSSPAIQGQQTTITDEAGNYRFILLPPGVYTVKFDLPGFRTLVREEIIVSVGKTTTINAALAVATTSETVTVTGESPVVDVTAATVGVNFDKAALNSVLGDRDQWAVLATTPGIRMNGVDVGGSHMGQSIGYNAYGISSSNQNWQTVDGVLVTCFYNDFGAVAEMQVSAAANSAETMTPGASVNQVLKTGGNTCTVRFISTTKTTPCRARISRRPCRIRESLSATRSTDITITTSTRAARSRRTSCGGSPHTGTIIQGFAHRYCRTTALRAAFTICTLTMPS